METDQHFIVSTFLNPHLFWLLPVGNEQLREISNQLNTTKKVIEDSLECETLVLVEDCGKNYRATIQEVFQNFTENIYILCWLIDYGRVVETKKVYKLPDNLKAIPAQAVQASLNNVVYVQQICTHDENCKPVIQYEPSTKISPVCRQECIKLLKDNQSVKFVLDHKLDNILLGDIIFKDNDGSQHSLIKKLIEKRILIEHPKKFKETIHLLKNDFKHYVWQVLTVYRKTGAGDLEQPFKNKEKVNVIDFCEKLALKYLKDFPDTCDEDLKRPLHCYRRKRRNVSADEKVQDGSSSDTSFTKSFKDNPNKPSPKKIESDSPSEFSPKEENVASNVSPKNLMPSNSSEALTFSSVNENSDASPKQTCFTHFEPIPNRPKKKLPGNTVLMPAGATFITKPKANPIIKVSPNRSPDVQEDVEENSDSTSDHSSSTDKLSNSTSSLPSFQSFKHSFFKADCNCADCSMLLNEDEFFKIPGFKKNLSQPVAKEPKKKLLFNESYEEFNKEVIISCLDYKSMTRIEKQSAEKLLVHSESLPKPSKSISATNFHQTVHQNLQQFEYDKANFIQLYSWATLLRNQHTFLISNPQSGKTMAYLPVICTFLLEKAERYDFVSRHKRPLALIICKNSSKCEQIYALSRKLVGNLVKICLATYPIKYLKMHTVDLLITTPSVGIDLLKTGMISLKHLCHFVMEDGDIILNKFENEMNIFLALMQDILSKRYSLKSIQFIVCAQHWTPQIEKLLKNLTNTPLVCIANYLEAALYGRSRFTLRFVNSALKSLQLQYVLKEKNDVQEAFRYKKTVIVCKNDEIEEIQVTLRCSGIEATVITEDLSKLEVIYLEDTWTISKKGLYTVLLTTDHLLNTELSITCASLLIHYSLPNSWNSFVQRFCCLLDNHKSPLETAIKKDDKSESVIFIDESCENQTYKIFNFMNTIGLENQLNERSLQYLKKLKEEKELEKVKNQIILCDNIKLFGECKSVSCTKRHILNKLSDSFNYMSGKIKFKILEISDVASYFVKIRQHNNENYIQTDGKKITNELTETLMRNKIQACNITLGYFYAYCLDDDDDSERIFSRCQVLNLIKENVLICLIDKGTVFETLQSNLYVLPDEFSVQKIRPATMEIRIANYIPPYSDENFSSKSRQNQKILFEQNDYKNITFVGDICLKLGFTMWLQNVHEEVILDDKVLEGFQLSKDLIHYGFAQYDNSQLENLYEMCRKANIQFPIMRKEPTKVLKQIQVKPTWAFLDNDNVNQITFCSAISPSEVYVRLEKYNNLLYNLQQEIQINVNKPYYAKIKNVETGLIYLGLDKENLEYCRVQVLKIENNEALCFFVDYGDEAVIPFTNLKPITNDVITKLPFQSIQCRLHGVAPVLNDWLPDATNCLYDYAFEPKTDIFRTLYAKVEQKDEVSSLGQRKYSILLKDGFGTKNVVINQLLIDCGLATSNGEKLEDFELPSPQMEDNSNDQNLNDSNEEENDTDRLIVSAEVEDDDFSSDEFEFFGDNYMEFFKNSFNLRDCQELETLKKSKPELPSITAAPPVDYFTPDLYWSQNETLIKITIKLVDVSDYHLSLLKSRVLNFSCIMGERPYKLKLMLYELVSIKEHASYGSEIRIKLTKTKVLEWPRLIISKEKARNIHYDLSTLKFEEKKKRVLTLPKEINDSESSQDEEGPMYVVESELDSDLDFEIEEI